MINTTTTPPSNVATTTVQAGKFGLVGVFNTLLDFGLYNLFAAGSTATRVLVSANILSTGCAMIFSFFANRQLVFKAKGGSLLQQAALFFGVTAFGLWVLQTGTIALLTEVWRWPLDFANSIVSLLGLSGVLSPDFVTKNGAKAAATVVSLVWNFVMYKKVVFKA